MTAVHAIHLGQRQISPQDPCYVIAEVGVNHNGCVELAHRMIDAASAAGVNAVKFQTFRAEDLVRPDAPKADYQAKTTGSGNQFDMLKALELPNEAYAELRDHCREAGLDFMSTAFEARSLDLVAALDPVCLKWPSGELNNFPLLRQAARLGRPILLSTGMGSLTEISAAIDLLMHHGCDDIVILQCVSNYPARIEDQNLRSLTTMSQVFGRPVGFSDHTEGPYAALVARGLGMSVLEKHFTVDRAMEGPDHAASTEPTEFALLVKTLRQIETGLGDGVKRPLAVEDDVRAVARKSLVFTADRPIGHVLGERDLVAKRPAGGMSPDLIDLVVGQCLRRPVKAGDLLSLEHFS